MTSIISESLCTNSVKDIAVRVRLMRNDMAIDLVGKISDRPHDFIFNN